MTAHVPRAIRIGCVFAALTTCQALAGPGLTAQGLQLKTAAHSLFTPIALDFIGPNDMLVLEKNTGKVLRIKNSGPTGTRPKTVLDLPVNFASERGLLGIAVHPNFSANKWVYLFWSESTTGADSGELLEAPLLGNRVDRYMWDGNKLIFDRNLIRLRSFQNDNTNPAPRANHDGGVLSFGPDGKLYIIFGDVGRRGWMQNNLMGPNPDDQFGGPAADNAHWSGVIIRLNDDGSTPTDNPFIGAQTGNPEVDANFHRTFAYGIRNSFGMAFDPMSGNLWFQENGEDAYDELNLVTPGMNSGWIQTMGPLNRVADYRKIEMTALHHEDFPNLQQLRWPPENIAETPEEALDRMFEVPGGKYHDPKLSWRYVIAPAAIGFVKGNGLGEMFNGDMIMGLSTFDSLGGALLRFDLTIDRQDIAPSSPDFLDRVVDNADFHDLGSTTANVIGTNFGIVTDIKMGPNGHLFVVSLTDGAIYEIWKP